MTNIDYLMKNYPLDSDSVDTIRCSNIDEDSLPNGGFPPIYICDEKNIIVIPSSNDKIKREHGAIKKGLSIKSILTQKRNVQNRYK